MAWLKTLSPPTCDRAEVSLLSSNDKAKDFPQTQCDVPEDTLSTPCGRAKDSPLDPYDKGTDFLSTPMWHGLRLSPHPYMQS